MKPVFVGLGEILWDLLPSSKQLGGAPANFAFHAHALGAEGLVASCIGDDDLGREIFSELSALTLSREYVFVDPIRPTGTVSVDVDEDGQPTYTIFEKVAWDCIPQDGKLLSLAQKVDGVCFGTLAQRAAVSRTTIRAFLRTMRPDALRVFDLNLRSPFCSFEVVETSLRLAQVLKISESELTFLKLLLHLEENENAALEALARRFDLRLVALTKGARGSVLYSQGRFSVHPGVCVDVVDTVGAGDSFAAALALGLLKGYDLDRINDYANRVASFVCTQDGATSPLPEKLRKLFAG